MIGTIDQAALQLRSVAQAAYTQESTYSYDDDADLTLAIEDEIIDAFFLQGRLCFSARTTTDRGSYRALRLVFQILGIVGRVSLQGCLQLKGVNSDHLPL